MSEQQRRSNTIVKLSFAATPLMFVFMAGFMIQQGTMGPPSDPNMVRILGVVLCVVYAVTILLEPLITRQATTLPAMG